MGPLRTPQEQPPQREVQTDDVYTWTLHLSLDVITGESPAQLGHRGPSPKLPEAPTMRDHTSWESPGSSCCGIISLQAGPPTQGMLRCEPACICVSLWQLFKKHQHCYCTGNEKSSQLPVDFYVLHSFLQQEIIKKKYKL